MNTQTPIMPAGFGRSLLRIPEVAQRLRVGRSTIYYLLAHGAPLRVVHIGRSIRIEASSVDVYIEQLAANEIEAQHDGHLQRSA